MDADAEFQEFLAGVQALRDGRVGGVEVAVAALPSIGQMLVAGLVQPEGGNLSLEVARWVADEQGLGSRVAAERTLKLETAEEFRAAQRLLEQAEAVLPERRVEDRDAAVLGHAEGLAVSIGRPPGEPLWVLLSRVDGESGVAVPVAEWAALTAVLAEAERSLARAGIIATGPAALH
jgi:hypothetical protein